MSFFCNIKLIADYLPAVQGSTLSFEPTYHRVAQAFGEWPVVISEGNLQVKLFEWGLIADYMNTPEKVKEYRMAMANARSEKILGDKRSVWHRLRRQRCLVFTTGFFEHHDAGLKKKVPFFIRVAGQEIFALAGLYNYSPVPDPQTGELPGTFAIVTRSANSRLARIHNSGPNAGRMPLILTKELALQWLRDDLTDLQIDEILRFQFPASGLEDWSVPSIRTRKADDETVITGTGYELA